MVATAVIAASGSLFARENTRHGTRFRPAPIHCKAIRVRSNAGIADFMGANRTGEHAIRRERAVILPILRA